jgi:hypothetical protein
MMGVSICFSEANFERSRAHIVPKFFSSVSFENPSGFTARVKSDDRKKQA